ncbi:hypothetical protein [Microbacterium sp. zg-YB36]|uniref:hypothetical protein n=1 Tax=Microbacterium sp. zg-YB36 TaxID=2969407 RepID=UPI00214D0953|nr:hypothetical protein [Microbacterium sp. zg-YB36]MDL5351580.1 hypothetical protein [Microbacterium sp. zg-YB36]
MNPPGNSDIVAGFNASIPDAEKAVVMAAKNVATYADVKGDLDVLRLYSNVQFFITQVDLDIRVSLRNLLADPSARITAEKYLALALIEAERGVGILLNQLRAAAGKQHGRLATFVEIDKFQEARDAIEARLKPMREDKRFSADLTLIRNEVVAHFVSKESGVENSAKWALSRDALDKGEDAILRSKIVEFAIALSLGLRELSQGMTKATETWMKANVKV